MSDHTSGSGFYLSTSHTTDQVQTGDMVSVLQSPDLKDSSVKCFVFWYFIWGDLSKLTVSTYYVYLLSCNIQLRVMCILSRLISAVIQSSSSSSIDKGRESS